MLVHLMVAAPDLHGPLRVAGSVGVQDRPEPRLDKLAHALDRAAQGRHGLDIRQHQGPLGYALGQVAAAFQVGGDLQGRHRLAQVVGHGLAQGDQADGLLLDVGLDLVQAVVLLDDLTRQVRLPPGHRPDGVGELGLGQTSKPGALCRQAVQFVLIGLDDVFAHERVLSRSGR